MGGLIGGTGPTGITPGGGAATGIMEVSPMLGACIIPECGGPRGLEPGKILAPSGGGTENVAGVSSLLK
jgi:hypothetical protein